MFVKNKLTFSIISGNRNQKFERLMFLIHNSLSYLFRCFPSFAIASLTVVEFVTRQMSLRIVSVFSPKRVPPANFHVLILGKSSSFVILSVREIPTDFFRYTTYSKDVMIRPVPVFETFRLCAVSSRFTPPNVWRWQHSPNVERKLAPSRRKGFRGKLCFDRGIQGPHKGGD